MKINTHTSHPSAFISSTFIDLKQEREAVADVLKYFNLNINALDVKPASNTSSKKEIRRGITESDFVILIVGKRYGSILPQMTGSDKLSITRWEYNHARLKGKHFLVYFKRVNSEEPRYYDDPNSKDIELKRHELKKFKSRLSERHNPKYFETAEELSEEIKTAIIPIYRSGVESLLKRNEKLRDQVNILEQENRRLKAISTANSDENHSNPNLTQSLNRPTGLLNEMYQKPRGLLDSLTEDLKTDNEGLGLLGQFSNPDKN